MIGTIRKLVPERGFGFIQADDDGQTFFFHATDVEHTSTFMALTDGERVEFNVVTPTPPKGARAHNVRHLVLKEVS